MLALTLINRCIQKMGNAKVVIQKDAFIYLLEQLVNIQICQNILLMENVELVTQNNYEKANV